jgi:hypothetical protein
VNIGLMVLPPLYIDLRVPIFHIEFIT